MIKISLSNIIAFLKGTGIANFFRGVGAFLKSIRESNKDEHIKKGKRPFFRKPRRTKK